MMCISA